MRNTSINEYECGTLRTVVSNLFTSAPAMKKLVFLVFGVLIGAALFLEFKRLTIKPWPAAYFESDVDHFKYGSIGAEVNGVPYNIWRELPTIFADRLPNGYAEFGFITEPGHDLPIGVSVRRIGVPRVGFNCGTCHVSTFVLDGQTEIVLGAPANALDIQAYISFLIEAAQDERMSTPAIVESAKANGRPMGLLERLVLRWIVVPRLEDEIAVLAQSLQWLENRPAHGPGRTDAGNFWRERWELHPAEDTRVGTVDFPSVWNQRIRLDGWFHWDGNNRSLDERNISAALAGGAQEWLLERESIGRVSDWLMDLPPPAFPLSYDTASAEAGRAIFEREGCNVCHDPDGSSVGMVTSATILGTDSERTSLFDSEMVGYFQQVGQNYSWQFENYQVTDGYANMPLDGIWMRAPYLHNGSVPTLVALLSRPEDRPETFFRGCANFDPVAMGFVCHEGFAFDATLTGNGNGGHLYGTALSDEDKAALLEYLKSL